MSSADAHRPRMSFTEEHLSGRPDAVRRVFEAAGLSLRSGRGTAETKALCPFHDDHTPSLSINIEMAAYFCHACGVGGDAVDFFAKRRNLSDTDAIAELRKLLSIPSSGLRQAARGAASRNKNIRYEIRDASGELKAFHIRTEGTDGKKTGGMPWEPAGIKTAELPLYGSERLAAAADPKAPVIVCEGEKATDSLLAQGYAALGTVTGAGGIPSATALEVLRGRDVVLWPDNDEIGRQHMRRVAAALDGIARSVRRLTWGEEKADDAFDFFARGGSIQQLESLLAEAETAETPGLDEFAENAGVSNTVVSIGEFLAESPQPVPSILGDGVLCPGTLNLLAGEDGTGKTMLALNLGLALAAGRDFLGLRVPKKASVLFAEAEGNATHFRERVRTAAKSMGVDPAALALNFAREPDLFAIDGQVLEAAIAEYRPDLVILDTVGYFNEGEENSNSDWKQLVSKPLHRLARQYETAFLLIQHLSKPSETRAGKHRVRGASAQSGDSDTVMTLDRSKTNAEERVWAFEKVKNGPRLEPMVLRFDEGAALFTLTDSDPILANRPPLGEVVRLVAQNAPVKWTPLVKLVMESLGVAKRTAESLVQAAYANHLIEKDPGKRGYTLPVATLPFRAPAPPTDAYATGPGPVTATAKPQPLKGVAVVAVPAGVTAEPQLRSLAVIAVPAVPPPGPCIAFAGPSDAPCEDCGDPYWGHGLAVAS